MQKLKKYFIFEEMSKKEYLSLAGYSFHDSDQHYVSYDNFPSDFSHNPFSGINLGPDDLDFFRIKELIHNIEKIPIDKRSASQKEQLINLKKHLEDGLSVPHEERDNFDKYRQELNGLLKENLANLSSEQKKRKEVLVEWIYFNYKNNEYVSFDTYQSLYFRLKKGTLETFQRIKKILQKNKN